MNKEFVFRRSDAHDSSYENLYLHLCSNGKLFWNIDPKKAKRIIANRASAARSKMKQKEHLEKLKKTHSELTGEVCLSFLSLFAETA